MWEYNYDYLCHGIKGHKYIDRQMGKNGKWIYTYPGDKPSYGGSGHRTPLRTETGAKMKFRPLLTPEMVSFDLHTKEVLSHPENHNWDNKGYWEGVKKDYQLREESRKGNTKPTTNLGKEPLKKSPAQKPEENPEVAKAVGALIGNAAKDLNSKITGAVKNSKTYKETLGDEDFKAWQKDKQLREEFEKKRSEFFNKASLLYADGRLKKNRQEQEQFLKEEYERYISELKKKYPEDLVERFDRGVKYNYEENERYWKEQRKKVNDILKNQDKNGYSMTIETSRSHKK